MTDTAKRILQQSFPLGHINQPPEKVGQIFVTQGSRQRTLKPRCNEKHPSMQVFKLGYLLNGPAWLPKIPISGFTQSSTSRVHAPPISFTDFSPK